MQLNFYALQVGNSVTLWICIPNVHGLNLAHITGYTKCYTVFLRPSRQLLVLLRRLSYDHFLPNLFKFINHQ